MARVVIVGAGVVGCWAAGLLARHGAAVTVVEKGPQAGWEASSRAMGSLRVQGRQPAELPLASRAMRLWRELAGEADFEFVPGGNLYLAQSPVEMDLLEDLRSQAAAVGLDDVRLLDQAAVRAMVPFREGAVTGALHSPMDAHCHPAKAAARTADWAVSAGAVFRYGQWVREVITGGDGSVRGVRTADGGVVPADLVVVAAGLGTVPLCGTLGVDLPVKEVLVTQAETTPAPPLFSATLRARTFSARQRPTGHLILGAGLDARVDKLVSAGDLRRMRQWMPRYWANRRSIRLRLLPSRRGIGQALRGQPDRRGELVYGPPNGGLVRAAYERFRASLAVKADAKLERLWAGFIDNTLDGLPVIERRDRPGGLVIAAGFSGHGLGIAPAVGEAVAALATGESPPCDLAPFRSSRFSEPGLAMPERFI